jgi:hypothetical protein
MQSTLQDPASLAHSRPGACRSTPAKRVSDEKLQWATPGKSVDNPQRRKNLHVEVKSQWQSYALGPNPGPQLRSNPHSSQDLIAA